MIKIQILYLTAFSTNLQPSFDEFATDLRRTVLNYFWLQCSHVMKISLLPCSRQNILVVFLLINVNRVISIQMRTITRLMSLIAFMWNMCAVADLQLELFHSKVILKYLDILNHPVNPLAVHLIKPIGNELNIVGRIWIHKHLRLNYGTWIGT